MRQLDQQPLNTLLDAADLLFLQKLVNSVIGLDTEKLVLCG